MTHQPGSVSSQVILFSTLKKGQSVKHQATNKLSLATVFSILVSWSISGIAADQNLVPTGAQTTTVDSSTQLSSEQKPVEQKASTDILIVSAISEPEDNMARQFLLDTNDKNEILRLTIKPEKGEIFRYELDTLLKQEVLVSTFKGVDTVMMSTKLVSPKEAVLKVRYLKRIPSSYETFDLRVKLNESGAWTVYQGDSAKPVSWIIFRSKTLLGAAIGIETIDFFTEKPSLAH